MSSIDAANRTHTATHRFGNVLGRPSTGRPWWVLVVFVVLAIAAGAPSGWLQSRLSVGLSDYVDPHSESAQGRAHYYDATGIDAREGFLIMIHTDQQITPSSPPPALVNDAVEALRKEPAVVRVDTYATTHDPNMISTDGRSTYVLAQVGHIDEMKVMSSVRSKLDDVPGLKGAYEVGGQTALDTDVSAVSTRDLSFAESFALPILLVLLLIVFRGVVAALVPLVAGVLAITLTFGLLVPFAATLQVSVFALNLVFALGLGLSIDFSLLMLTRFREELGAGLEKRAAVRRTLDTAGRTITFSTITISVALGALLIFPQPYLYSMSIAGILVTISAALIALFAVPAVLTLLGPRINALSPRRWRQRTGTEASGFWYRFPGFVMRHPGLLAAGVAVVLIGLTTPVSGIRFTGVDAHMVPKGIGARNVFDQLRSDFPQSGYHSSPVTIYVAAPPDRISDVRDYADSVSRVSGVDSVAPPSYEGDDTWVVFAFVNKEPLSDSAQQTVSDIRAISAPVKRWVAGETATFIDLDASLGAHLPLALILVALTTFTVLFLMTGSVVLPIKALIMNVLSLGAAFGVLVIVFQHGFLHELLGFSLQSGLESSSPLLVLALVFGLSTDYEVFLLSRIKEAHDGGADTRSAVQLGLGRTGRVVTAAALLLCVALAALILSRIILIKELGLGTTFAVLVDASLVRAVLVPALMAIMLDLNWWAPRPLRFIHDRLHLNWAEAR